MYIFMYMGNQWVLFAYIYMEHRYDNITAINLSEIISFNQDNTQQ